jgi:cupin 2 domain-containing protein
MIRLRNIYNTPKQIESNEFFENIAKGDVRIERILSSGQTTPIDEWYDQESDEWVILLDGNATIIFENTEEISLQKGDYFLIKAHEKHRVTYTSIQPPCVWLAVHGKLDLCV